MLRTVLAIATLQIAHRTQLIATPAQTLWKLRLLGKTHFLPTDTCHSPPIQNPLNTGFIALSMGLAYAFIHPAS